MIAVYEQMVSGSITLNKFVVPHNQRTEPSKEASKSLTEQGNAMLYCYEDVLFNVINANFFYQRDGIIEPTINSMNIWSDSLIEDIEIDIAHNF